MRGMDKTDAIMLLGGTHAKAAAAVGVSVQAISAWPDPLPPRIADRVQAALWRREHGQSSTAPQEADAAA